MATKQNNGKKKGLSTGAVLGIGAGVVAAAAATYFFFGPEGKKNRQKLKGWMIKMKGDIVEKMENAKDLTEAAYHKIVDAAAASYEKKGVSPEAVREFAAMLKRQWKGFSKPRPAPRKRAAKKATKKTGK
jgi:gas vesicle protein